MAEYNYIGDGCPDGIIVGYSASEKVAFHGAVPVVQAATLAAITTTTPTITAYGYTLAQATAILANLNAITTALINKGILAAS